MEVNGYEIKPYANLRGADLRGADLQEADLRRANLQEADLRRADLQEADLRGAYLRGADLQEADLREADLRRADLREADLQEADLREADLQEADLRMCIGNRREIKTLILTKYHITYTKDVLAIGCEQHTKEEWLAFDDETIKKMESGALEWWREWKPKLEMLGVLGGE